MRKVYDASIHNFFEMLWKNELMGSDRFSLESCYIQKADGDLDLLLLQQ